MDDADRASFEVERSLAEALRTKRESGPVTNGRCHWCDEAVGDTDRWCSTECAADWNREAEIKRRSGCKIAN